MDMLIVLCFMVCVGIVKAMKAGGFELDCQPTLREDGTLDYGKSGKPPIGNNLRNLREIEPFTFIVRQLGLKQ